MGMGKRRRFRHALLFLVCSICFCMPFVELANALPKDDLDDPPTYPSSGGTYTGTYAPATYQIAGKTLRRVDPGFPDSYGGGFSGVYSDYSFLYEWVPGSASRSKCWYVHYTDTSIRKSDDCWNAPTFEFEYVDSNGWAFKYRDKYMSVSLNGDVRVNKTTRGAQEKFYIYQDVNQPEVYYIKANSNGKWICTDWTGWVVANRDAPYEWERVWINYHPFN